MGDPGPVHGDDLVTVETRPTLAPATEPRVKSVPDVLRHAARIIEERGWCQRDMTTPDGRVCLVGAIVIANGCDTNGFGGYFTPIGSEAWDLMWDRLVVLPSSWNDTPGRTAAEVIAALNAAADAAESQS